MPDSAPISRRPPLLHALLLWLLTNTIGTAVLSGLSLLFAFGGQHGVPPSGTLGMGLAVGVFAGLFSAVTIPFAALLFHLLTRLRSFRYQQVGAALGLTALCLLPVAAIVCLFGSFNDLLWLVLPYWPAALASGIYLYRHWLFAPAAVVEVEPWV